MILSRMSTTTTTHPPTAAMMQLMEPDGYYKFLGIDKPSNISKSELSAAPSGAPGSSTTTTNIDTDAVKKNYRKLSLKYHPDKQGGDIETFRLLNRAQKVLSSPKLRQQYDILGIDLDEDENDSTHDEANTDDSNSEMTAIQAAIDEIARMCIQTMFKLMIRTAMVALVSLILVRYRWTVYPAILVLFFAAYQNYTSFPVRSIASSASPIIIALGLYMMYIGRAYLVPNSTPEMVPDASEDKQDLPTWTWTFVIGESFVIAQFTLNSMPDIAFSSVTTLAIYCVAFLIALWFRGLFWNYVLVLGLEAFATLFVAMSFPIMEMLLEAILNEKLRKIGDKVRAHHQYLQQYYKQQNT